MKSQNQTTISNPLVSIFKLFNARLQVINLASYFFFLSFILCFGVFLVFYGKTTSFDLQVTEFDFSPDFNLVSLSLLSNRNNILKIGKINAGQTVQRGPRKYLEPQKVAMHKMDDTELMWRASRIDQMAANIVPKVAFMFLTKDSVPLAPLWDRFFLGQEGLFSIYVHSDPRFNGSESDFAPETSVFHNRRVPSKVVEWGKVSMIEAERRLLGNALLDASNQRFVLLSESCIPLFNFSTVYSYLINSSQTFVELYDDTTSVGLGRYSDLMQPQIRPDQWRKGSQWFQIDRGLAQAAVEDRKYFPVFQKHCRRKCYSDEHYLPTLVHVTSPERNSNRTLTFVDWSRGGAHPASYRREHVTYELLERLRSGDGCEYNGERVRVCHLFARKFTTHALDRLLRFAPKFMYF